MNGIASRSPRAAIALGSLAIVLAVTRSARADEAASSEPAAAEAPAPDTPSLATGAKPANGFGESGSVVLDNLLGLGLGVGPGIVVGPPGLGSSSVSMTGWVAYSELEYEASGGATSVRVSTLAFAPSFDVFVARHLSIGSQVTLSHSSFRSDLESSALGGGLRPRIGWVVPLTEGLVLWPRAFGSVSVVHLESVPSTNGSPAPSDKRTSLTWGLGAEALLVAPLGRVVALTFGPTLAYGKTDAMTGSPAPTQTSISLGVHGGISLTL